jgi:formylglycine-generating enzyme required for sulfatase activity
VETSKQQRRPAIGSFAKTLADANLHCDAIDLADMLWLAQFMEPGQVIQAEEQTARQSILPESEPVRSVSNPNSSVEDGLNIYVDEGRKEPAVESFDRAAEDPTLSKTPEKIQGTPFSVPAAPSLRTRLDLSRALRPLMRKVPSRTKFDLDEEATATQIAEIGVWLPVVKPRPERWLELDLVVEDSKTTVIWERAIAELNHLAEYQGAFRTVRTWRLNAETGQVQLFPRWRDRRVLEANTETVGTQRPHSPGELIDPTGRRLIWLVTDCTSQLWNQDLMYETLSDWAQEQPIAIIQMFPERLWSRTALRDGHIVRLSASPTGLSSSRLEIEGLPQRLAQRSNEDLVTVPVVTLEALSMLGWARVAANYGDSHTPGRTFDRTFIRRQAERGPSGRVTRSTVPRTAQERVALFRSTASKTAQQLADLMAAAPVSLPVIDLLRDAFRGDFKEEVQQSDVAEVLLSGLLRRCDTAEEDVCRYEFWGDDSSEGVDRVRDILLGDASVSKTVAVLDVLSVSICQKLGSPAQSFQALLGELGAAEGDLRNAALPFAKVGLDVLRRLGGEYAALARRYESEYSGAGDRKQEDDDFPLKDLEYEVAKFIDFPPLQICEYESATITAILDRFDFETTKMRRQLLFLETIEQRNGFTWGYTESLRSGIGEDIGLDMIAIPGGSFMMGAPKHESKSQGNERPQHKVNLQPFYLGRYQVTQAQWKVVASYKRINRKLSPDPSRFKENNRPVENIQWEDAKEFCLRLSAKTGQNYRLPSEAQWEYACRAETETPFHFGEIITTEVSNYNGGYTYNNGSKGIYRQETTEVGIFPANEWGLHDMHGNVWEWCADHWHDNYFDAPNDGSAWVKSDKSIRLLRGGSWYDFPRNCRSANRNDSRIMIPDGIGFRVCCVSLFALTSLPEMHSPS